MKKITAVLICLFIVCSPLFSMATPEKRGRIEPEEIQVGERTGLEQSIDKLENLFKYLDQNYYKDIDYDAAFEAMANALFDSLGDKYTFFVGREEAGSYKEQVAGKYGGLGFYFSKGFEEYKDENDPKTLYCVISQVFPNTPADKAGIAEGDLIVEINGESVVDKSATDCSLLMKGEAGTDVVLKIRKKNLTLEEEHVLTREIIVIPTVEHDMIDDSVAYMRINEFSFATGDHVKRALSLLMGRGMKKLIIDLRNNPGGDVSAVLKVADLFISDGGILHVKYKGGKEITYNVQPETFIPSDVKIVMLVNENSASSAEILASCMKDRKRAVLIGTKTFGKGIMQVISPFSDCYTSITTAEFYPPSGEEIHKTGVLPDIEVESPDIADEEKDAFSALIESGKLENFVDKNPEFTKENMKKFLKENPNTGISQSIVLVLLRNEYYSRMEVRPLFDVVYDSQLRTAYDYIRK